MYQEYSVDSALINKLGITKAIVYSKIVGLIQEGQKPSINQDYRSDVKLDVGLMLYKEPIKQVDEKVKKVASKFICRHADKMWLYISLRKLHKEYFSEFSESTVIKAITWLVKENYLFKEKIFTPFSDDIAYAINENKLEEIYTEYGEENPNIHLVNVSDYPETRDGLYEMIEDYGDGFINNIILDKFGDDAGSVLLYIMNKETELLKNYPDLENINYWLEWSAELIHKNTLKDVEVERIEKAFKVLTLCSFLEKRPNDEVEYEDENDNDNDNRIEIGSYEPINRNVEGYRLNNKNLVKLLNLCLANPMVEFADFEDIMSMEVEND